MGKVVDFHSRAIVSDETVNHWEHVPFGTYRATLKDGFYIQKEYNGDLGVMRSTPPVALLDRIVDGTYHTKTQVESDSILLKLAPSLNVTIPHESIETILRIADVPWKNPTNK